MTPRQSDLSIDLLLIAHVINVMLGRFNHLALSNKSLIFSSIEKVLLKRITFLISTIDLQVNYSEVFGYYS